MKSFEGRGLRLFLAAVFILTFLWILLLTQGLPIGDFDDWDHVLVAQDIPYTTLLKNFSTPWSLSEHWTGQFDRINEVVTKRIVLSLVLKTIAAVFDLKFLPFFIFSKAIFFSLTALLLAYFLNEITRSRLLSVFGILFYVCVPAHYPHLFWVTDPITMVHPAVLLGLLGFYRVIKSVKAGDKIRLPDLLLFFISGWIAMKTKEPALVLPLSVLGYLAFNFKDFKSKRPILWILGALCVFLLFQLVPVLHLNSNDKLLSSFHLETFKRMVWRNYACGYEDELVPALFSFDHVWPASIARTLTCPLLWTLTVSAAVYLFIRKQILVQNRFLTHPLVKISALWILIEFYFMGKFQPDPRYFSGTMIPITIVIVCLAQCLARSFSWGKLLMGGLILSMGWSIYDNIDHVRWLRLHIGQRNRRLLDTAAILYKDTNPDKTMTRRDQGLFYTSQYFPDPTHPHIKDHLYYMPPELGYSDWSRAKTKSLEEYERMAGEGAVYYADYEDTKIPESPNMQLLGVVDSANPASLFERLARGFKKKKLTPLFIYKWKTAPAAQA